MLNLFNAYNTSSNSNSNNYDLWHKQLDHIGKNKFLELKGKEMVDNIEHISKIILKKKKNGSHGRCHH